MQNPQILCISANQHHLMGKDTATSGKVKIFNDAIHAETIKKEMRVHRLYENYMLTPAKVKDLVITNKPTGDPTITGKEMGDGKNMN